MTRFSLDKHRRDFHDVMVIEILKRGIFSRILNLKMIFFKNFKIKIFFQGKQFPSNTWNRNIAQCRTPSIGLMIQSSWIRAIRHHHTALDPEYTCNVRTARRLLFYWCLSRNWNGGLRAALVGTLLHIHNKRNIINSPSKHHVDAGIRDSLEAFYLCLVN